MDSHCQHAESAQQCWGGRAGRHAVCCRRQRRHQLLELRGAVQPQDKHLGGSGSHEHTQVSLHPQFILQQNGPVCQKSCLNSMIREEINGERYSEYKISI